MNLPSGKKLMPSIDKSHGIITDTLGHKVNVTKHAGSGKSKPLSGAKWNYGTGRKK